MLREPDNVIWYVVKCVPNSYHTQKAADNGVLHVLPRTNINMRTPGDVTCSEFPVMRTIFSWRRGSLVKIVVVNVPAQCRHANRLIWAGRC